MRNYCNTTELLIFPDYVNLGGQTIDLVSRSNIHNVKVIVKVMLLVCIFYWTLSQLMVLSCSVTDRPFRDGKITLVYLNL